MIREAFDAVGLFTMPAFSFVNTGVRERERGYRWKRTDMRYGRWKDRGRALLWFLYALAFIVS